MSIRPSNLPPVQDMPPPGGFAKVDMSLVARNRGPTGWQLWLGSAAIIAYGYYQVGRYNRERIQQRMQERKMRYAMVPMLQAEADLMYAAKEAAIKEKEAEIMKNVDGWIVGKSPYYQKIWMPRAINPMDPMNK